MTRFRGDKTAFGAPGIDPRWTRGNKDGVGTAYSSDSKIWYSIWRGTLTEVYYPTVDRPQLRDMEYLVSDGKTFYQEEKRHLNSQVERLEYHDLGYRVINSDLDGRYRIRKEIISDPHLPCILQHTRLEGQDDDFVSSLRLFALCAPHLDGGGAENNAYVASVSGRDLFLAEKNGTWLAMGATTPFKRLSCGYVGFSDGWTDINDNMQMDWEFDQATNGNVAMTGELDLGSEGEGREFTLGIALGESIHSAVTTLFQSLGIPFVDHRMRFLEQWDRPYSRIRSLDRAAGDGGNLYHASYSLILAHEDKTYPGALIASLSIPWGEAKGDDDKGGYHLVWTRDMVNSATALLAAGNTETPLRALIYLAASQQEDGGFPQNFWIDGQRYWGGIQLDEVALPIILAWKMAKMNALENFDPYNMVRRAASYLLKMGPATEQDRWEEASGYSPSTLATNIAALICAAQFLRKRGGDDEGSAKYLEEYADFLVSHVERWTCTNKGTLVPGIPRHFVRILPVNINDPQPLEDPDHTILKLSNQPPFAEREFPASQIVDPGFLELVRYGIISATDPLVVDSVKVVDAILKRDTPFGPCWHRYNHDGYGQRNDGAPFEGWGQGRLWPLLTGERGHYELMAHHDVKPYIEAMEKFSSSTGLLPEQVWDAADIPGRHMHLGRSTGSAMPLVWAHAEYVKLLRSASDGLAFDLIDEVADRYIRDEKKKLGHEQLEIWKFNRQLATVKVGSRLRIQASESFILHWSLDDWKTRKDSGSIPTGLDVEYVDIPLAHAAAPAQIVFTFYWRTGGIWEGEDYKIDIADAT